MAEIKVLWRRTWQIKPYETETIELGLTDTFSPQGATAEARGAHVGTVQRALLAQLTQVGDAIMAERLAAAAPGGGDHARPY